MISTARAGSGPVSDDAAMPVKYALLARRRAGMTPEAFKAYYEGHHSRLIYTLKGAPLTHYIRRYLHPQQALNPSSSGFGHDVLSELWTNTQADMDALMHRFEEPEAAALFATDEAKLFDRSSIKVYSMEEHESDLTAISTAAAAYARNPSGPVVKSVLIARRRPDMSLDQFRDYYENHHSKVVNDLDNPPLIRYFRRFLHHLPEFDGSHNSDVPSVVMEMWYRSREDMNRVDRAFYESDKVDFFIQDEGRLFDRASMKYYVSDDHESDLRPLREG